MHVLNSSSFFFFSSRRRHTRCSRDWSSDVCSSDLLEWTEVLDHSQVQGQGLVGFDPASDRFFSTSVYNVGSAPELLTGVLDDAQPSITFYPISILPAAGEPPPVPSSTLAVLDRDHFTWTAQDRAWRAVFSRQ